MIVSKEVCMAMAPRHTLDLFEALLVNSSEYIAFLFQIFDALHQRYGDLIVVAFPRKALIRFGVLEGSLHLVDGVDDVDGLFLELRLLTTSCKSLIARKLGWDLPRYNAQLAIESLGQCCEKLRKQISLTL